MASNYQYIEVRTNQSHKMNEAREKRKKNSKRRNKCMEREERMKTMRNTNTTHTHTYHKTYIFRCLSKSCCWIACYRAQDTNISRNFCTIPATLLSSSSMCVVGSILAFAHTAILYVRIAGVTRIRNVENYLCK